LQLVSQWPAPGNPIIGSNVQYIRAGKLKESGFLFVFINGTRVDLLFCVCFTA
jgi:hypothetical protein